MNPILIILILLAGVLLWFFCASLYKPFGKKVNKMIDNSVEAMKEDEEEEKEWKE